MAMSLPLIACILVSEASRRFWPSKRISPSGYSTGGFGLSCIMLSAVTLLPLPDSPTIPRVSPGSREKETPSTAFTIPSCVLKWVFRLFTSSITTYATLPHRSTSAAGVQEVVYRIAEEAEPDHRYDDRDSWKDRHPPGGSNEALRVVDQIAPTDHVGVPEPEEAQ